MGLYFFLEHNFVLDILSHGETSERFLGVKDLLLNERLINYRKVSACRKDICTLDDSLDSGVGLRNFPQLHGQVDEMSNEAFPGLIDRRTSLDLLIFFDLLTDEV